MQDRSGFEDNGHSRNPCYLGFVIGKSQGFLI